MVSLIREEPTAEQLAFRKALMEDPELSDFLDEMRKPVPKREPRILPDLTQQKGPGD